MKLIIIITIIELYTFIWVWATLVILKWLLMFFGFECELTKQLVFLFFSIKGWLFFSHHAPFHHFQPCGWHFQPLMPVWSTCCVHRRTSLQDSHSPRHSTMPAPSAASCSQGVTTWSVTARSTHAGSLSSVWSARCGSLPRHSWAATCWMLTTSRCLSAVIAPRASFIRSTWRDTWGKNTAWWVVVGGLKQVGWRRKNHDAGGGSTTWFVWLGRQGWGDSH